MDIATTFNQIIALSIHDRIHFVQAILDSIAAEQDNPDLTDFQKQELDRRIDDYEANPDNVLTWKKSKPRSKHENELCLGVPPEAWRSLVSKTMVMCQTCGQRSLVSKTIMPSDLTEAHR